MVFESLVTEVLNRFLGSYIENLDTNQLNIGIWGGDVVLKNLSIKGTAISDLNLPIKLYQGHLGKLTLKIPWKNLYSAPVIASIEDLYILLLPNAAVKYDEQAEEKARQEIKQKELEKIEEAKKKQELAKENAQGNAPKQDSFVEKMVSQVIKNLQVNVSNIHIRYEDSFSNPSKPFAFGATLSVLSFNTTDENWKQCIVTDAIRMIYKIVRLEALSLYWNSDMRPDSSFVSLKKEELLQTFASGIAQSASTNSLGKASFLAKDDKEDPKNYLVKSAYSSNDLNLPPGYVYLLKPLTSLAQLRLNSKPELDGSNFTTPKVLLNLIVEGISLGLRQCQYQDILELLESLENLNLKSRYRKYRPDVNIYPGHYKAWWHFAMKCVLDEVVKPRLRQWSWKYIAHHRALVRKYIEAYKIKLTFKKIPNETKTTLDGCEKKLDVFNITLARQQASLQVKREGVLRAQQAAGWFSGWLGGWGDKSKSEANHGQEGIAAKFNEAMTPEERKKLYQAIDYTETGVPAEYPEEFVQNVFHFKLFKLSLSLYTKEHLNEKRLTQMVLNGLGVTFEQCPGADASQLEVNMDNFSVFGMDNVVEQEPLIIRTIKSASSDPLVHLLYESNPLDKLCDQRIHFLANPLEIIFDAATVNHMGEFFKPPESVKLKQLHNAAVSTIEDVKQTTATGYKYAMEKRKVMDLKVEIKSSHVLIPQNGVYQPMVDLLLLDLGTLTMNSVGVKSPTDGLNLNKDIDIGDLMEQSYDKIELKIDNIQLLYAKKGDDWQKYKDFKSSPLHLLKPGGIKIRLEKSIITDDPKMPKLRIFGVLPDLTFDISDKKLEDVLSLLMSIPPAQSETAEPLVEAHDSDNLNALDAAPANPQTIDSDNLRLAESEAIDKLDSRSSVASSDNVQLTALFLKFEIKMISLNLYQEEGKEHKPLLSFCIKSIGATVESRTFDTIINAHLKAVTLENFQYASKTGHLYLINSADNQTDRNFVSCNIIIANVNGPDFVTEYERIEKNISVKFCPLKLRLHQEALTSLLAISQNLQSKMKTKPSGVDEARTKPLATSAASNISTNRGKTALGENAFKGAITTATTEHRINSQSALLTQHDAMKGLDSGTRSLSAVTDFYSTPHSATSVFPNIKSSPTETVYFSPSETLPPSATAKIDAKRSKPLAMTPRKRKDGVEIIDMSVDIDIESVSLGVLNSSINLASISLNGLTTQVYMQRDKTKIQAVIQNLAVDDKMPGIFYKNILSTMQQPGVGSSQILKANVVLYNNGPSSPIWKNSVNEMLYDVSKYDTSVDLTLGGVCIVVLMPFIIRLQAILDSFTNTKEKIAEAGAAAAEAASQAASNLHKTAARIGLRIEMKAPFFIVPRSSKHPDAIILDLGTLRLANHFSLATPLATPPHGKSALPNRLEMAKISSPSILDKMMIELNDFKISRILVDDQTKVIKAEVMILEPANISLEVRRNLMFDLNPQIPEIDITGQISNKTSAAAKHRQSLDVNGIEVCFIQQSIDRQDQLFMSMSEEDLAAIMNILSDNFSAPQPAETTAPSTSGKSDKKDKRSSITPSVKDGSIVNQNQALTPQKIVTPKVSPKIPPKTPSSLRSEAISVAPSTSDTVAKPYDPHVTSPSKFSFKFQFDKLAASLYYGSSNLSKGTAVRDPKKALSRIEIVIISVCGTMKTDNALDTKISLYNLILEDKRPAIQSGITRMIEMRKDAKDKHLSENLNQLIHLTYQQDPNNNKNIGATVNRLYVCLCIDFLMSMSDFFTKNMPKTGPSTANKSSITAPAPSKQAAAPSTISESGQTATSSTLLRFLLNEPEIVLIENAMNVNTKALILTMQLGLLYDQTPTRTLMDGKLSQLQIIACPYQKESREGNVAQILNPLDITLSCDAQSSNDQVIVVDASDIVLNISPATIRVLTAVANTKGPEKPVEHSQTDLLSLPPNLWDVKDLSSCDYWFLHTEMGHDALDSLSLEVKALSDSAVKSQDLKNTKDDMSTSVPASPIPAAKAKKTTAEQLNVNVRNIMVTIEAGVENRTVPMVKLQSRMWAQVKNWSSLMNIRAKLTAEAGYYNEYMALWEPLIEPMVSHDMADNKIKRPWELIFELTKNPDVDEAELNTDLEENKQQLRSRQAQVPSSKLNSDIRKAEVLALLPQTSINVTSKDVLNVTLTKSCLQMINNLSTAFGDAVNQKEPAMKSEELNAPYLIYNRLGCDVLLEPDKNLLISETNNTTAGYLLETDKNVQMYLAYEEKDIKPVGVSSHQIQPHRKRGSLLDDEKTEEYYLEIKFPAYANVSRTIAVNQVRKIFIEIPIKGGTETTKYIEVVAEITSTYGCKRLTLESPLKLINYFSVPMEVHVVKPGTQGLISIASLATKETWHVPLNTVATYTQFFFKPHNEPYNVSKNAVEWKTTAPSKLILSCEASNPQYEPFYLSVCETMDHIYGECENEPIKNWKDAYFKTLHIMPTVSITNLLPYPIAHKLLTANMNVVIAPGDTTPLYNACVGKSTIEITIENYVNKVWTSTFKLNPIFEEFEVLSFYAASRQAGGKRHALDMGLHIIRNKGMLEISIFSPYWMINQTGLTLFYQRADSLYNPSPMKHRDNSDELSSVVEHKAGLKLPFLFSFRPKAFFSKKKACIKVENSEWSDKFSLDTVGSSGVVSCKYGDSSYEIGVEIVLSKTGFTKVVTFIPYYTIVNKSKLDIQIKEYYTDRAQANVGDWQSVIAGECIPFWPKQSPINKNMALIGKFKGSTVCTTPFPINRPHATLMALDNKFGGINVECHVSDVAVTITFDQYYHGQDVILLINHTGEDTLYYHQSGIKEIMSLPPNKSVLFAWRDALQQEKYLVWSCGDRKNIKFDIIKDGFGEFNSSANHHKIYWVSFLDGTQRVLMFTEDLALVCIAQQAGELEKVEQEIDVCLEGVSLSVVDNWQLMSELIYASICSTGAPIWELCTTSYSLHPTATGAGKKPKTSSFKYKALKQAECEVFERAYQEHLIEVAQTKGLAPTATLKMIQGSTYDPDANKYCEDVGLPQAAPKPLALKPGMTFDFDRMALIKRSGIGAGSSNVSGSLGKHGMGSGDTYQPLRRTFRPGLWFQYRTSPHQMQLHAKLNKLQVDDQIPSCTFPVVLGVVPLPKSISSETVPRPLFEVSMLKRNIEHSSVQQIKYFKVLVQETFTRADQGFINTMISFFTFSSDQINLRKEDFDADLEMAETDMVRASADRVITIGQKNFYDFLHFSPIKIHLSFSLQASGQRHHKDARVSAEEIHYADMNRGSSGGAQSSLSLRRREIQQQQMVSVAGGGGTPSPSSTLGGSNAPESSSITPSSSPIKSAALNFLLQSVGVTLTDIDDVVFKLAYFERTHRFYTQSQLMHEVTKHYVTQALKQMYVLVLGLDVLGNPFGLIRGLTEGMGDLFYEPYQGAIQGPEEFAQGLALGVRSLFGHTIGGAAGAVSRITGTLGKGLAALTMDQDYQKSRREELNKRPADLKEGVARGGKGLVMGFYEGVAGIVTKPMEGAKQEGATGFFKGVGKGLVGVVARPTSGVVDFASSSFQGIKRLAENVDEVHRQRPRRYIQKDGVIRPYDFNQAEGYEIFRAVEKGHSDQTYLYHTFLSPDMKTVLILTNESIFLISKGELFGQWVIDWSHTWDQIVKPPIYIEKINSIRIDFKGETKKKKCMQSLLSRDDANYHMIALKNREKAEIIIAKINEIMDGRLRST